MLSLAVAHGCVVAVTACNSLIDLDVAPVLAALGTLVLVPHTAPVAVVLPAVLDLPTVHGDLFIVPSLIGDFGFLALAVALASALVVALPLLPFSWFAGILGDDSPGVAVLPRGCQSSANNGPAVPWPLSGPPRPATLH